MVLLKLIHIQLLPEKNIYITKMLSVSRNLALKLARPPVQLTRTAQISTSSLRLSGDDPDLKMGPFPRTKEERERAAKKYNLIPEDYEPFPEDLGHGDYPNLKAIGAFNRDQYDDFDYPIDNRFYGEVFHRDADLYYWERVDPLKHEKAGVSAWVKVLTIFCLTISVPTFTWFFKTFNLNVNHPWKQRYYLPEQRYYEFPKTSNSHH